VTADGQTDSGDLVGVPESRAGILTLLDYASLMRGLELLPHRRAEVLASFELDELLGQPEIARWEAWLATHPSDKAECAAMAERMTAYWQRWDKTTAMPQQQQQQQQAAQVDEEPPPNPKNASLELMAKLSEGLRTLPDRKIEVFRALGARTHDEHVDLEIALDKLTSSRDLDVKGFLALRSQAAPFWQRWLSPPTLSMVDYARLVIDLERAQPKEVTNVYRAHRLVRVSAERELSLWKKRLAEVPGESERYEHVREQLLRTGNVAPQRTVAPPPGAANPWATPGSPIPAAAQAPQIPWLGDPNAAPMTARAVTGAIFTRSPAVQQSVAVGPTMPFVAAPATSPIPNTPRTGWQEASSDPPPIGLLEYTVLCLQLEVDAARSELHYRRLGLLDQADRDRVHSYWQARFAVDPQARQEWIEQAQRLRGNWQGSRG
jgi:hypothetical protein